MITVVLVWLLLQNTVDWVACNSRHSFLHCSGGWGVKDQVPAQSVGVGAGGGGRGCECSFLDHRGQFLIWYSHGGEQSEAGLMPLVRTLVPFTRLSAPDLIYSSLHHRGPTSKCHHIAR